MSTLKERLIEARKGAGFSQQELADAAGCGQTTIASIENGRNAGSKVLPILAKILNVNVYWLTGDSDEKYLNAQTLQLQNFMRRQLKDHDGTDDELLIQSVAYPNGRASPSEIQQEAVKLLSRMDVDDAHIWLETTRAAANKARRKLEQAKLPPEAT